MWWKGPEGAGEGPPWGKAVGYSVGRRAQHLACLRSFCDIGHMAQFSEPKFYTFLDTDLMKGFLYILETTGFQS